MSKQEKSWGTSEELHRDAARRVCVIDVQAGGRCSLHLHRFMTNIFVVTNGELHVTVWDEDATHTVRRLTAGDSLIVAAGQPHQFVAQTDVTAYEVYHAVRGPLDPEDIYRRPSSAP